MYEHRWICFPYLIYFFCHRADRISRTRDHSYLTSQSNNPTIAFIQRELQKSVKQMSSPEDLRSAVTLPLTQRCRSSSAHRFHFNVQRSRIYHSFTRDPRRQWSIRCQSTTWRELLVHMTRCSTAQNGKGRSLPTPEAITFSELSLLIHTPLRHLDVYQSGLDNRFFTGAGVSACNSGLDTTRPPTRVSAWSTQKAHSGERDLRRARETRARGMRA